MTYILSATRNGNTVFLMAFGSFAEAEHYLKLFYFTMDAYDRRRTSLRIAKGE